MESATAAKQAGPGNDVPDVLRAAALAAGVSETPEEASHPHGRSERAWRLGPTITLFRDPNLHYDPHTPAWVLEHRRGSKGVATRHTCRTLREAAAEAVSLLVRERVLKALSEP